MRCLAARRRITDGPAEVRITIAMDVTHEPRRRERRCEIGDVHDLVELAAAFEDDDGGCTTRDGHDVRIAIRRKPTVQTEREQQPLPVQRRGLLEGNKVALLFDEIIAFSREPIEMQDDGWQAHRVSMVRSTLVPDCLHDKEAWIVVREICRSDGTGKVYQANDVQQVDEVYEGRTYEVLQVVEDGQVHRVEKAYEVADMAAPLVAWAQTQGLLLQLSLDPEREVAPVVH